MNASVQSEVQRLVSAEEWQLRVNLAACYRLVALHGWSDLVFTHISVRIPGPEHHFLINPYGLMFDEITASNLIKVDQNCKKIIDSPYRVNPAGFVIHSAVHAVREDIQCVLHTHTRSGIAVSAQKSGILPISQQATFVLSSLAYHDYEGVAIYDDEKSRLQADLESRLDWVAVDHWDTDNPHTHVVLRGRAGDGRASQDLVIAPDYMAHGMRMRASEIATEWLGPRTELEIRQGLLREVEQERLTSLDRMLSRQAVDRMVDLTKTAGNRQRQTMLRARLQRLGAMGLAQRIDANHWRLAPDMARSLTTLGERVDILRAMHRAMKGERRDWAVEARPTAPIIGRIAGKGLADELHDRGYLVIDGVDGRVHYVTLPIGADLAALPMGGIVKAKPVGQERGVDRSIAAVARCGIYKASEHLVQLTRANDRDPQSSVDVHVRRLEALRRAGIVERMADGVWQVPPDLMEKALQHDAKATVPTIELHSHFPIEQQAHMIGATWLDKQLVGDGRGLAKQGFGAQVRDAMHSRVDFLANHGLAERQGQRVVLTRNLLSTLRDRELTAVGQSLQEQTGRIYRPLEDGARASGIYRQSVQLASGRFVMLDDGMSFRLVPWRPVIEQRLGQQVSAVTRGQSVTWQLGPPRGLSV